MAWPARKGLRDERRYGVAHRALRRHWAVLVAQGLVPCNRCHQVIKPGETWHLDHDDQDRNKYRGPAHSRCNVSAASRKGRATVEARKTAGSPSDPRPRPLTQW